MIEIYGADWCKPCQNSKLLCQKHKVDFEFLPISDPDYKQEVTDRLGYPPKTIPVIFKDGEHIGGYNELKKLLEQQ